jgi:putative acetyltransferase
MIAREHLLIRPVRAEDAEAVNAIRRQPSVMEFTMGMPSERISTNRAFLESLGPDDHVLIAEVEGQVAGMAGLHVASGKRRHVGTIGIMVHESFQGQGVGAALMEALLDIADSWLGLVRVELDVLSDNTRALQLNERLGFVIEGTKRKDFFGQGRYADVHVMARVR